MSNDLTIADADRVLWELSDLDLEAATQERRNQICEALDYLTKQSDYHIFGVCADTTQEALSSLQNYAAHFRYELPEADVLEISDGVYIKYNPRTRRYHSDNYKGLYRGVLISFHTDFADGYSGTHGHFPLDLF
ncbi:MAG: DUF1824 domain-containing protein [Pseudanabaena frigida]|uniref:DUF1824 domain-containing protein n=1 Tax=Pseudanabaena frigida TaxID=945775 RepID=A0A2W4WGP3_9CYAN|nr:MAG: DUF1824 domain-containing protein [Pseudanabaena frigida]